MQDEMIRILCRTANVQIIRETKDGTVIPYFADTETSPLAASKKLRETIKAEVQENSSVYFDAEYGCYYNMFPDEEGNLYLGPLAHDRLSSVKLRQMYYDFGMEVRDSRPLATFTLPEIRDLIAFIRGLLYGNCSVEQIHFLYAPKEEDLRNKNSFLMKEEAEEEYAYRHSYQEEQALMEAIREGRSKESVALCESMDRDSGRLSASELTHRRYMAIIGVAICARAAVQGGISPGNAYRLSGYYIQKCDEAADSQSLLYLRNKAVAEFADLVNEESRRRKGSNYTDRIRNYVKLHFREKILLEELSEELGLSPTYVSRLFRKETGIRLQDYINMVRIERAEQLLAYTDLSLTEISDYVHFPNQSYFGKIFKQIHGISPRIWRDRFRTDELRSATGSKKGYPK